MGNIIKVKNATIEAVLKNETRQYLAGNLKNPQKINHINDENIEIGITDYNEYTDIRLQLYDNGQLL